VLGTALESDFVCGDFIENKLCGRKLLDIIREGDWLIIKIEKKTDGDGMSNLLIYT
jgi:hypothetical protein